MKSNRVGAGAAVALLGSMPATANARAYGFDDERTAVRELTPDVTISAQRVQPTRDLRRAVPPPPHYAERAPAQHAPPPPHYAAQTRAPAPHAQPPPPHYAAPAPAPQVPPQRAPSLAGYADAPSKPDQQDVAEALSLVRRFAIQADLGAATRILARGIEELLGCDTALCLTADPLTGQPWVLSQGQGSIAALAAGYGRQVAAQPARTCPAFNAVVDNPSGSGEDFVLAQPIMAGGGVIAVLVAVRALGRTPFAGRESELSQMVADQCGPLLLHAVHTQAQQRAAQPSGGGLFRGQALESHRTSRKDGALLSLSPSWIRVVYPAVLLALGLALAYGLFARVDQYSSGLAIIRIEGSEVTARTGGTVLKTYVRAGQKVKKGDLLVQLHSDSEDAELGEINLEYEQEMASFLFDPSNDRARDALAKIKARKQKAEAALGARAIRAPRAGYVSDLRIREGSRLEAGDFVTTIAEKDAMPTLIALLPGADRPRLQPGMTVQIALPGYQKAHELATISHVGEEVISPREAKRVVGGQIADAVTVKGSVVVVRAKLASRTFRHRDGEGTYYDGLNAKAEVSVKSRSVLVALIPALEKWL